MDKPSRENWSWQKLGDSVGAKVAAVVVISIAGLWALGSWDEPTAERSSEARDTPPPPPSPPQIVTSFDGVQLGQKMTAAASTHGPFDKEAAQPHAVKKHADEVAYKQKNGPLRLGVRQGVVHSIAYGCKAGRDPAALNNVACHDLEDRVRKVFGDRLRVLCARVHPDDPNKALAPHVRAYDAVEYGTRYIVIKDEVQAFMIMDAKELDSLVGFNWVKCG